MKNKIQKKYLLFVALLMMILPSFALSQGIVPDCGADCNYKHVGDLINNIIKFIVTRLYPVVFTISLVYAGILFMTAAGDTSKIGKAKAIVKTLVLGLIIMLSAWLIVYTLLKTLGATDFITG